MVLLSRRDQREGQYRRTKRTTHVLVVAMETHNLGISNAWYLL